MAQEPAQGPIAAANYEQEKSSCLEDNKTMGEDEWTEHPAPNITGDEKIVFKTDQKDFVFPVNLLWDAID